MPNSTSAKGPSGAPDRGPATSLKAPLVRPWPARMQTLAVLLHSSSILLLPACFFLALTRVWLWPALALYCVYAYVLDDTLATGAARWRQSGRLRRLWIYRAFVDYFPIRAHRTMALPPSIRMDSHRTVAPPNWTLGLPACVISALCALRVIRMRFRTVPVETRVGPRYLFAYHPHGVIAFGVTGVMCCDDASDEVTTSGADEPGGTGGPSGPAAASASTFSALFPGIPAHLLTLTTQFSLPFYRDYLLALGVGQVTKAGIRSLLEKWHSVAIVVGGAHESLLAKPGRNAIVINRRKGFVKIALQVAGTAEDPKGAAQDPKQDSGSAPPQWSPALGDIAIVPTYGFGENNIHKVYATTDHDKEPGKLLKALFKVQVLLKKVSGFTLPLVNSRAVFNYDFGLLPYRHPIHVVYGEPLYVVRKFGNKPGDPVSQEEIDYYHALYKDRLYNLWRQNKRFASETDEDLKFVE